LGYAFISIDLTEPAMPTRPILALTLLAALSLQPAAAQNMKPGLWEVNTKMGGSAELEKAMATMQQQLASMPADQRKMMEDMMAKQGVNLGGAASGGGINVKMCVTREMAARNHMPVQTQGQCTTTQTPVLKGSMKYTFTCKNPPSSGEGEVSFTSDTGYSMKLRATSSVHGQPQQFDMTAVGRWMGADCGSIKPLVMPAAN
jgi:hypothetical protein